MTMNVDLQKPLISIIIPIYNAEKYLNKCLDSLKKQSMSNIEIICVNDGSSDASGNICEEYVNEDKRFKIIHTKNNGAAEARKIGFLASKGELISFVDADDWLEFDTYENVYKFYKKLNADIIVFKFFDTERIDTERAKKYNHHLNEGFYKKEELINLVYPYILYSPLYKRSILPPGLCDKVFKRSLLNDNMQFISGNIVINEDQLWCLPAILDANTMYVSNNFYYHYRDNNSSITHRYKENFFDEIIQYNNLLIKILKSKKKYEYMQKQVDIIFVIKILNAVSNELKNKGNTYAEKVKIISTNLKKEYISKCLSDSKYSDQVNFNSKIILFMTKNNLIYILVFVAMIYKILRR